MGTFSEDLANLATKEEETRKDEPTSESQPETGDEQKTEPTPSQEESKKVEEPSEDPAPINQVPFNKHPRWIRMQQELKELRELAAKATEKAPEAKPKSEGAKEVPKEFERLFGDDVQSYEQWNALLDQRAMAKAQEYYETRQRQEQETKQREEQAQSQAAKFAEDQFLELAEETGIAFHDRNNTERNQILDICVKYGLFDPNGMPNIKAANELRPVLHPPKSNVEVEEKKKVIAKTNAKTNASQNEEKVFTSSKLKKMNMSQFFNS